MDGYPRAAELAARGDKGREREAKVKTEEVKDFVVIVVGCCQPQLPWTADSRTAPKEEKKFGRKSPERELR